VVSLKEQEGNVKTMPGSNHSREFLIPFGGPKVTRQNQSGAEPLE
jgi:hypothetical protein